MEWDVDKRIFVEKITKLNKFTYSKESYERYGRGYYSMGEFHYFFVLFFSAHTSSRSRREL
jgi:hypothetical protein